MLEIKTVSPSTRIKDPALILNKEIKPAIIKEVKAAPSYVENEDKISLKIIPFIFMHIACFAVFLVGFSWTALLVCLGLYAIRMFGLTAGFHRYFSHRSFKTSRFFQFILALLGTMAVQKGPLWWAAHHRRHHKYSDQEGDVHSPIISTLWWSHIGWVVSRKYDETHWSAIKDFA